MIRVGTLDGPQASRRQVTLENGATLWKSDLIVSPEDAGTVPQAYLVEQDPNTVTRPHYHPQNQFQVVIGGEGMLGRHPVEPITVHYAGQYTGYGPIIAGNRGVAYFTLRAVTTTKVHWLPESRAEMKNVTRCHLLGGRVEPSDAAALRMRAEVSTETLIEPQPDGIAASLVRLPPGASASPPELRSGGSRFYLVAAGAMLLNGQRLPRLAASFATADERGFQLVAGDEGLEVLALQFPTDH